MRAIYICGILAGLFTLVITPVLVSCTSKERAIVRDVVDILDQVCGDNDTVEQCLLKAQHRAAVKTDAGASDASGDK